MMHFHIFFVKMVVINEISAQNNPHTIKFSTQNALGGHKIDFGIHFCTPHIQVDFSPYHDIPYILFPFQCRSMLNPHFNPFKPHPWIRNVDHLIRPREHDFGNIFSKFNIPSNSCSSMAIFRISSTWIRKNVYVG